VLKEKSFFGKFGNTVFEVKEAGEQIFAASKMLFVYDKVILLHGPRIMGQILQHLRGLACFPLTDGSQFF